LEARLAADLVDIAKLKGPFKVSEEAMEFFDFWYNKREADGLIINARTDYEKEWLSTSGDHLLKLAMVLSVSESNKLNYDLRHLQQAIILLEEIEENMFRCFRFVGTDMSVLASDILNYIYRRESGTITMMQLITAFKMRIKHKNELTSALDTLRSEGLIIERVMPLAGKTVFVLTEEGRREAAKGKGRLEATGVMARSERRKEELDRERIEIEKMKMEGVKKEDAGEEGGGDEE
jgi:hypothetical protein